MNRGKKSHLSERCKNRAGLVRNFPFVFASACTYREANELQKQRGGRRKRFNAEEGERIGAVWPGVQAAAAKKEKEKGASSKRASRVNVSSEGRLLSSSESLSLSRQDDEPRFA